MQQLTIGILMYPGAQLSAVHGLMDLFFTANRIMMERTEIQTEPLMVSRWHVVADFNQVEKMDGTGDRNLHEFEQLVGVIIPPNLQSKGQDAPDDVIIEWVKQQHEGGAVVCSICTSAFILAHTGLLNGRPATTHWALKDAFATQFPKIQVCTDQMVIEDGDIITAGGVTAWIDLGLRLIDRFLNPSVMLEVAQFFLVDPSGREQRFYSKFAPRFHHGDEAILEVQHWLQTYYHQRIMNKDMAKVAVLADRTFLRRFQKATGMKPTAYLQALRVGKAKELLESSQLSFNEITWKVGYEDQGAFRRIFQRLTGLTPSEYRRRFAWPNNDGRE